MKELGNIYLSWRKGAGHGRFIVGIIRRNFIDGVRFSYIKNEVDKSLQHGFTPYTEFPDINITYSHNVLEIFGKRLVNTDRADKNDFYDFWEINPKYVKDKFYLL